MSKYTDENLILTDEKKANYVKAFYSALHTYRKLSGDDGFDLNRDRIAAIFKDYSRLARCLKNHMVNGMSNENIDSHKIAAIFFVLVQKHRDVIVKPSEGHASKPSNTSFYYTPEIHFGFIVGNLIMEGMYNIGKEEKIIFDINMGYGIEFTKMVYANRKAILSPAMAAECNDTIKGIFCLSHLFYFIERTADKSPDIAA